MPDASSSARNRASSAAGPAVQQAAILFGLAVALESLLHALLYLRPNPFGRPFALDPANYLFHAMYYGAWAQAIVATPLFAWAHWRDRRGLPLGRTAIVLQITVCTVLLVLGATDRECQRFLGMHMDLAWLRTYFVTLHVPDVVVQSVATDRGGAWSSLWGLGVALEYVPLAIVVARRTRLPAVLRLPWVGGAAALALLGVPTILWVWVPGGKHRQAKVRPVLLSIWQEVSTRERSGPGPDEIGEAVAIHQSGWLAAERDGAWVFDDPQRPLHRRHVGAVPPAPATRPNFIVVQLETFRAKDMRSMNPELEGPAPTPFLDALAADPNSAAYRRYYASAVPTVHAMFAIHTGLPMHPYKSIASEAADVHIDGLPAALGRSGYHTLHFAGSDPDWDGQRTWLERWYDEVHYWPEHEERDRPTFRAAADRIREVASGDAPFFAYVVSISNHTPFRSPEPQLALGDGHGPIDALHDTMHYTDDVVRELFVTLGDEPWFANTIFIVTGDHAYDLGDRGEAGGFENLRHETTWVPLIVHGADPRLPRGPNTCVASQVDLAPPIAELAGVWDDQSYVGHSLLGRDCQRATAVILR
ncbi:MAG TPA: LTA synthase family protein, partial [Nannocystaceae bacterium]|nr:LTA synthase family protein [Nannocystaceae bacterium]